MDKRKSEGCLDLYLSRNHEIIPVLVKAALNHYETREVP